MRESERRIVFRVVAGLLSMLWSLALWADSPGVEAVQEDQPPAAAARSGTNVGPRLPFPAGRLPSQAAQQRGPAARKLNNEITTLAQSYRSAESDEQRTELGARLKAKIGERLDMRAESTRNTIKKLEDRIATIKIQLSDQTATREATIERRFQALVSESKSSSQ